jgi:hypothetical protein
MLDPFTQPGAVIRYAPRSRPAFPGDIQHDLRDHLLDQRPPTLADWVGEASALYLRAARILRCQDRDALAVSLAADPRFDARTLFVAHDHMVAHWRHAHLPQLMSRRGKAVWGPDQLVNTVNGYGELTALFRYSLRQITRAWADHRTDILHLFLLAVTGEHTRTGRRVEAELYYTLGDLYPVPGLRLPRPLPVGPA